MTFLGTGGPRRDPARNATALLVRTGAEEVLADCGRGTFRGLAAAGADIPDLRRVPC